MLKPDTVHADSIPIVVRLLNHRSFQPGPFHLGKAGYVIAWIAVAWITTITVTIAAAAAAAACSHGCTGSSCQPGMSLQGTGDHSGGPPCKSTGDLTANEHC